VFQDSLFPGTDARECHRAEVVEQTAQRAAHETKAAKLCSASGMAKLVRRLRREADLPTTFTLDTCRHCRMTELQEVEVTGSQACALSRHKSRACERYAKRTMERALGAFSRLTLEELPDEFGISRERPRQIEVPAVEKLKKGVRQCISASGHPQTSAIIMKP
jgi:hypothetical protein